MASNQCYCSCRSPYVCFVTALLTYLAARGVLAKEGVHGVRGAAPLLIIDTDAAGLTRLAMDVDDDLALLMAYKSNARIAAITVTYGNAPASLCLDAVRRLTRRLGWAVPVFQGADCVLPLPHACASKELSSSAASEAISDIVLSNGPRTVTIVALGPLTNIAAAISHSPAVATAVKEVVIVGGQLGGPSRGLLNQLVANLYFVPDMPAVRTILRSSAPLTFVPVDTMLGVLLPCQWLEALYSNCSNSPAAPMLRVLVDGAEQRVDILNSLWGADAKGTVAWDPIVMAFVLQRRLFRTEPYGVKEDTFGLQFSRGDPCADNIEGLRGVSVVVAADAGPIRASFAEAWACSAWRENATTAELAAHEYSASPPIAWGNSVLWVLMRSKQPLPGVGISFRVLMGSSAGILAFCIALVMSKYGHWPKKRCKCRRHKKAFVEV